MKKSSPIIVVAGEPNSIFLEIFFKSYKRKIKTPIILIASYELLKLQMKKLKFQKRINILNINMLSKLKLNNSSINLINVDYNFSKPFEKISRKSNLYIENCFKVAFEIIEKGLSNKLINGPISKKSFLSKKYLGITEYISDKFFIKNNAMLIYNNNLSVCPITTHLPLKLVSKQINKKIIKSKINLIFKFFNLK